MKIFRNLQSLKLRWISTGEARGTPLNPAPLNPPAKFKFLHNHGCIKTIQQKYLISDTEKTTSCYCVAIKPFLLFFNCKNDQTLGSDWQEDFQSLHPWSFSKPDQTWP